MADNGMTTETFQPGDVVEVTAYRRTEVGLFVEYDSAEPARFAIVDLMGEWWTHRTLVSLTQLTHADGSN